MPAEISSMNRLDEASDAVKRMERQLASGVPIDRLTELIAPGTPRAVMERLLAEPRFAARLSRLMMARLDLVLSDALSPDLRFAALGVEEMKVACAAVGAVWHYNAIRQVIARPALRNLIDAIGENAYRIATTNSDLSVTTSKVPALANLVCSIQRTGHGCVDAWLEIVDAPIAAVARLKLSTFDEPLEISDEQRRLGPAIVRRVAESWSQIVGEH
jgi:hypothetical protein